MKRIALTFVFLSLFTAGYSQVDCDKLFTCFKQGERPNCASIALIKASLNVYGLDNLFKIESIDSGSSKVTLKNDDTFSLTTDEISKAGKSADFTLINDNEENRKIVQYAILAYAVMAKYKQIIDKESNFENALYNLESGAYSPMIYQYLGFKKNKQIKTLRRLSGGTYQGLVAWSSAHAVFACEGYMDYHGTKTPLWFKYSGRFRVIK